MGALPADHRILFTDTTLGATVEMSRALLDTDLLGVPVEQQFPPDAQS